MVEDGGTVIGEGKGAIPLRTGCKNEKVVTDAFARGQHDIAVTAFFALFDRRDAADLDGAIVLHKEIVVRDERGLFEFVLRGGCHADARGEMNGKRTRGHEGEGRRVRIDFGREDAGDGRASCAATDDYDALAGHCIVGLEKMMRRKQEVVVGKVECMLRR